MLRILHVIPSIAATTGGPPRSLAAWIDATRGTCASTVATTREALSARDERDFRHRVTPGELRLFDPLGRHTANVSPALIGWLVRHARSFDVIHVHALMHPISSIAARIAQRSGTPFVLRPLGTLSEFTLSRRGQWLRRPYLRLVDRPSIARAAAVHFTTRLEQTLAGAVAPVERPVVIPVPVAARPLDDIPDHLRDPATVLFLSRIDPKKNLECLIDAFARLRHRLPRAKLVIAGGGEARYVASIRERIEAAGVAPAVELAGFVAGPAKRALLERATVFALPSHNENFSNATVEAMAHGLVPVISGGVGIAADVAAYRAGVVTPGTPQALCAALEELLAHPARRREMAANAHRLVTTLYAPATVRDQLVALYESIAPAPR